MRGSSTSCWQCGTVLSTTGGRCPACGAEQPPPTPRQTAGEIHASHSPLALHERRRARRQEEPQSSSAAPWLLLVGGLAVIGIGAAVLVPRRSAPVEAAPVKAIPAPTPSVARPAD